MVKRSFLGRGPTLADLARATQAERARKAAAAQLLGQSGQVNTANTAAANSVTQPAATKQPAKKAVIGTTSRGAPIVATKQASTTNSLKAVQQLQSKNQPVKQVSTAKKTGNFVAPGRQVRSGPVTGPRAVQGKRLSEFNTASVAAQAAALSNAAINNNLVGGSGSSGSGNSTYYDVDAALADVYKQAAAAGVTLSRPKSYGKTVTDERAAQSIIDSYAKTANDALSKKYGSSSTSGNSGNYYDVDSNLNAMYKEAVAQGVKVNAPPTYGTSLKTESAAKAAQQSYVDYLDKQYSAYNNAAAANAKITVYDDLGRKQTITQSQLSQMEKAAASQTWRENYTVLPEEVANSNANWWINSNGLYEWTPVTQSDKDHLAQQNAQRKRLGQAPKTTLTCGASPSDAYSKEWYSTGGNRTQVARNQKLAALKASSSVNNSATAKTGTAKTGKATVITAQAAAKKQEAAQAQKKAAASTAASQAKTADAIAIQAKQEATAKQKAADQVKAAANKSTSVTEKAVLKKEASALQKDADKSKVAAKAADKNATAQKNLAKAASKAASAPVGSKSVAANKEVSKAAAAASKTQAAANKAGVTDHTGQILLKDGTWTNAVEKKGVGGKGEGSVRVLKTEDYKTGLKNKSSELKALQAARDAYKPVVINGKTYDAVQKVGAQGTGEGAVTVYTGNPYVKTITADGGTKITYDASRIKTRSGTANEYAAAMKQAKKIGSTAITAGMTQSTVKNILDARKYYNDRADTPVNFSPQSKNAGVVETKLSVIAETLDKLSKPGTRGQRHADALKKAATNTLSLKEDLAIAATPYIEGGKQLVAGMNRGLSLENLVRAPVGIARGASKSLEKSYGKSSVTLGINKAANWVQNDSLKALDKGVVTAFTVNADYSPLAMLNSYAKKRYGESRWTRAADLTTNVVKTLPIGVYKDIRERPASTAANAAGIYVGGAALGAATKVATLGGRVALKAGGNVANAAASKVEAKLLKTAIADHATIMKVASKSLYLPANAAKLGVNHGEKAVNLYLAGTLAGSVYDTARTGDVEGVNTAIKSLVVGGIGFGKGMKVGTKAYDRVRMIRGKEVPLESIVTDAEVLSGASQFPTTKGASKAEFLRTFKGDNNKNTGYHASTDRLPNNVEVGSKISRPADMPGLYVAPVKSGASPYFLRTEKSQGGLREFASAAQSAQKALSNVKTSAKYLDVTSARSRQVFAKNVKQAAGKVVTSALGESTPLNPTVHKIEFGKVRSMPNSRSVKASQKFLVTKNARLGDGYLTPRLERGVAARAKGTEAEAVITPGTKLQRVTSGKRYFKYNDRLVSLEDYKVLEAKGLIKKGEMDKRELPKTELKDAYRRDPAAFKRGFVPTGRSPLSYTAVRSVSPTITASQMRDVSRDYNIANRLSSSIRSRTGTSERRSVAPGTSNRIRSVERSDKRYVPAVRQYRAPSTRSYTPKPAEYTPKAERYHAKPSLHRTSPNRQGRSYSTGYAPERTPETRIDYRKSNKYTPARTVVSNGYIPKITGYGAPYPGRTPSPGGYSGNGGSRGGSGGSGGGNHAKQKLIFTFVDTPQSIQKKKKAKDTISRKRVKDDVKLTRDIKNRLGSLESMFGTSVRSPTKRKSSTVTPTKKATTKKTVKRVKRA